MSNGTSRAFLKQIGDAEEEIKRLNVVIGDLTGQVRTKDNLVHEIGDLNALIADLEMKKM